MTVALVVGEYCPLVRSVAERITALARSGAVVIVEPTPHALVPVEVRAEWVRRSCPGVGVVAVDAPLDVSLDDAGRRAIAGVAGTVDVATVAADHDPIGTAARLDPVAHWKQLPGPVRGGLTRRICFVGAESTGKTTLSRRLAERHDTVWVPEYGRDYTIEKIAAGTNDVWDTDDFVVIARRQGELEDGIADDAGPLLLCDTDAFATAVWHERYLGRAAPAVEAIAAARHYDLYVLCGIDVPFEHDGVRFSESIRPWMQQRFRDGLDKRREPWIEVTGSVDERAASVEAEIERLGLLTGRSMLDAGRWSAA